MDILRDIVEFHTDLFVPVLPEEAQVNPGVYGAELAFWLCSELAKRGIMTSYPQSEDWGWFIEYVTDAGSEFAVHCVNLEDSKYQWRLALRRHARKLFGRDKPAYEEAAPLIRALSEAVHTLKLTSVHWYGQENTSSLV